MVRIGNNGFCWSSAVNETNGVFLGFSTLHLNSDGANYPSYGLQLRCLSE
ncbi:hypothetical protein [uncultured Rikenella sp.]|nr:hypothetical protein [uncultured Rikenella sp.]